MNPLAIALLNKLNIHESEIPKYKHISITHSDNANNTIIVCEDCFNKNVFTKISNLPREEHVLYIGDKNREQTRKVAEETGIHINLVICEVCLLVLDLWLYTDGLSRLMELRLGNPLLLESRFIKIAIFRYIRDLAPSNSRYKDNLKLIFKLGNIDPCFIDLL